MLVRNLILEAVARGWCYPVNEHKEMDSTLAEAITEEVFNAFVSNKLTAPDTDTKGNPESTNPPKFQVGDIVVLKSGGPDMTVDTIDDEDKSDIGYFCHWFDGTKLEGAYFKEICLNKE